jgi:hypothetical protein
MMGYPVVESAEILGAPEEAVQAARLALVTSWQTSWRTWRTWRTRRGAHDVGAVIGRIK